jgi:Na+/H+-dicarboxylate symporter
MLKKWFAIKLWKRILGALVIGVVVGLIWGPEAESIKWLGDIFIRLIRMLIVPLILTTLVAGIVAMTDLKRLGSIGIWAFILYLFTTAASITIGLVLGTVLKPGEGVDLSDAAPQTLEDPISLSERMMGIIPINPFEALAEGNILAIIVFAVFTGAGILMAGEKGKPVGAFMTSASEVMLKVTIIVMEVAPFGVFALIAWVTGTKGVETLSKIFILTFAVYLGCLIHIVLVHGGLIKFAARLPVKPFFRGAVDPQLVAYSTSSSSATLPVTMAAAEENLGIGDAVRSSVLPLGATVNMDGTAMYVGLLALFSAQVFGIDLSMSDYVTIALTTTLVSIGTASVPSASLFLLAAVLETIGVTATQTAIIVGFILPFDRILDMMRTVSNVTGDLAVATVVAKWENEIDIDEYNALPEI